MPTLKTGLRAAQFNSMRLSEGIAGNLRLWSVTATGYDQIAEIESAWFAQRERDQIDGTQFLAVRIVRTDDNAALMGESVVRLIAAVGIGSRRYKANSKVDPFDDPALWALRCEPTGETI